MCNTIFLEISNDVGKLYDVMQSGIEMFAKICCYGMDRNLDISFEICNA